MPDVGSIEDENRTLAKAKSEAVSSNSWLESIPSMKQRQDSFIEQMNDLYHVAIRLGMYDAADGLKAVWGNAANVRAELPGT